MLRAEVEGGGSRMHRLSSALQNIQDEPLGFPGRRVALAAVKVERTAPQTDCHVTAANRLL